MPNDNLLYLLVADQELNVELDKRIVRRFAPTVVEPKGLAELGSFDHGGVSAALLLRHQRRSQHAR